MTVKERFEKSPLVFAVGLIVTGLALGIATFRFGMELGGYGLFEETKQSQLNSELTNARERIQSLESIEVKRDAWKQSSYTRLEKTLAKVLPQLISGNEKETKTAIATLHVLHLSQVDKVLERFAYVAPKDRVKEVQKISDAVRDEAISWYIVFGGFSSENRARKWVDRATSINPGFNASIYFRKRAYRALIGPYPSEQDAEYANIAIKELLSNQSYVVRDTWCEGRKEVNKGLYSCSNK